MNSIYCCEPEPVGALMLTGDWGCGKTYLIEHSLKDGLQSRADDGKRLVLRISLFGKRTVEEIQKSVQEAWFSAFVESNLPEEIKKIMDLGDKVKKFASKFTFLFDKIEKLVLIAPSPFVSICNKTGEANVILVFDDLERCWMDAIDVLKCINDFYENQKLHTIIVTNEDKIQWTPEIKHITAEIKATEEDDTGRGVYRFNLK